ncbi:MAG: leucine-rich repeat domain-containing protein [Rickettsiales bacterium]|nr:leucine-rich repeat domain-containing protein [Rickettsiales bacterium]
MILEIKKVGLDVSSKRTLGATIKDDKVETEKYTKPTSEKDSNFDDEVKNEVANDGVHFNFVKDDIIPPVSYNSVPHKQDNVNFGGTNDILAVKDKDEFDYLFDDYDIDDPQTDDVVDDVEQDKKDTFDRISNYLNEISGNFGNNKNKSTGNSDRKEDVGGIIDVVGDESGKNETAEKEDKKEEVKNDEDELIYSTVIDFSTPVSVVSFKGDGYQKVKKKNCATLGHYATEKDLLELYRQNKDLESLDISNCDEIRDFSVVSMFENLKELDVNNCDYFDNIECLAGCKKLRVLNIGNTLVDNIDNIGMFPDLRILNCCCNSITNIKNIGQCPELVELILWGSTSLESLDGAESLLKLRTLDIDSTLVTDLFPLSNCTNLEFLFMDNCTRLTDIFTLASFNNLKCLLMDGKSMINISQLEVFNELLNLEYLTMSSRRLTDVSFFSKMVNMKELILKDNNITDLRPFEEMTAMKKIDLTANSKLIDLSPLHKMTSLKKLIIGGGGSVGGKLAMKTGGSGIALSATSNMIIEDISVVKNMKKLEEINLSNNPKIKDISALSNCESMEEVDFSYCTQLEDVSALSDLKNLTVINMTGCPRIKDIYCLRNLSEVMELYFDGTSVQTPAFTSIMKKMKGIVVLKGNNADLISRNMLASGKKKAKLSKAFAKYFKTETDDNK